MGGTMATAEHEPITGVWGQSPQRGQGQSPWSGGRSHPEAESILVIGCLTEPANLATTAVIDAIQKVFKNGLWIYQQQRIYLTENNMLSYGPLVSELGGPECTVPPNPVIWGVCPPASPAPPHIMLKSRACVCGHRHIDLRLSYMVTKVDYCSTVLSSISGQLLQRLQSVFNAAARLVFSARKSEHTTPLLH